MKNAFGAGDGVFNGIVIGSQLQKIVGADVCLKESDVHVTKSITCPDRINWACWGSTDALNPEHEAYSKEEILNEVEKTSRKPYFEFIWLYLLFVFVQSLIINTFLVSFSSQHLNCLNEESGLHWLPFSLLEEFFWVALSHNEHIYEIAKSYHAYRDESD